MQSSLGLLGVASCAVVSTFVASTASASVITFTQQFVWEAYVAAQGNTVYLEDFNDIADGFYASPFSSSIGPVNWSATAANGIFVQGGQFSTNNPEALTFNFGPNVRGVGGNFYGTDVGFNVVPSIVTISLADGTSYVGLVNSSATYTGFYSTGAAITSLTIAATPSSGSAFVYPTADNMQFAVPAPGAIALAGLAVGLAGKRRRR
ncbi:MAG: hypothetical protein RLY21_2432 [Planctomycetota bacterium]|jgi:hypothetical protein